MTDVVTLTSWLQGNMEILATLGGITFFYGMLRSGAKKDAKELKREMKDIKEKVEQINIRLLTIEIRTEDKTIKVIHTHQNGTEKEDL